MKMDKIEAEKTARRRRIPEENPVSAMEFCGAISDDFQAFDEIRASRTINTIPEL